MKMLRKVQGLFVNVVNRIEGNPAPASRYFILFFAILAVRLALEFFSTQRLFTLDDVLHIGLWFAFIVLAFMLQLNLFSGVPMQRVAKLVVVSFTIALTAPIIDLILRGGVGAKMNYLAINSWADVAYAYVTVGGASLSRGATLGIRIEILLLVFASFNYLRIKTGSILRSILGTWCIYTVLFLSGTVPRLLGWIVDRFQLVYQPDDNSTVLFLLCLDLMLMGFILLRHSRKWMGLILQSVPWGAVLLAIGNFCIGAGLAIHAYPGNWSVHPTTLFWFPLFLGLALTLGATAGLHRLPSPPASEPAPSILSKNPTTTGSASSPKVLIHTGLLILIIGISLSISDRVFFAAMVVWGLIFLLNEEPLKLKHVPLLRNLLEVMALFGAALMGFAAFGGPMIGFPGPWIVALLGAVAMGSFTTDIGRMGDTIILWYRDWLLPFQKAYRVVVWLLMCTGAGIATWTVGLGIESLGIHVALLIPPFLLQLSAPKRLQWYLVAFLPMWVYWVLLAFSNF